MIGKFISFEGGEGVGKSTQIALLAQAVSQHGLPIVVTREPGGTVDAEVIRKLLVTGDAQRWSADAEALLNYAARASHLDRLIRPALRRGDIVVCDRFIDSSRAYQALGVGNDTNLIDLLDAKIVGDTRPDLTFILDMEPAIGLARAKARAQDHHDDRYEDRPHNFHDNIRQAFLTIAQHEPRRCRIINANRSETEIAREIWPIVWNLLDG